MPVMIQIAGTNVGEFNFLNVIGTANLSGQLSPILLNGFVPTIGHRTFLQYSAVNGTLLYLTATSTTCLSIGRSTIFRRSPALPWQRETFLLLTKVQQLCS
jgi:hypothetical protein